MPQSTASAEGRKSAQRKPKKPYPDFPLFAHANGSWAKKIRGKLHYFGRWGDADGELEKYLSQRDDLHAGRTPRVAGEGLVLKSLVNTFLTTKRNLVDSGELTQKSWQSLYLACRRTIDELGGNRLVDDIAADDFERLRTAFAKRLGPHSLANDIIRVRSLFKYAHDMGMIDRPVRYGQSFQPPGQHVIRRARAANGPRMFEADEIHRLLDATTGAMHAMVLLAVNCGYGNVDCARLPKSALDLGGGWVEFSRPKTGIERRCPLWPETITAIRESITTRPEPLDPANTGLIFLTATGESWYRNSSDPVVRQFDKVLQTTALRVHGRGFYGLRRTFATIASGSLDQVAVDHIMGHSDGSVSAVYRQRVSDERLLAVTGHVRRWLFPGVVNEELDE